MHLHQNPDNASKNSGILDKLWKTSIQDEANLTSDSVITYSLENLLVCNQEVAGSIPVVSIPNPFQHNKLRLHFRRKN